MDAKEIITVIEARLRDGYGRAGRVNEDGLYNCMYRDDNNVPCAVGAVMTDDEVAALGDWATNEISTMPLKFIPEHLHPHIDLLQELQTIHDVDRSWVQRGDKWELSRDGEDELAVTKLRYLRAS